jgi:hypothetical protein
MPKRIIDVSIDDEARKVDIVLDHESYALLEVHAEREGLSVEKFAKKVIEDGMMREIRGK